jgi:hypothetical protein
VRIYSTGVVRTETVLTHSIHRVSYRDLLGTAERIIEMDSQMHEVDITLGQAAQKCNSGAVDRIFKNYGKFQNENKNKSEQRNAFLPLLRCCGN